MALPDVSPELGVKLASIAVHSREALHHGGHPLDVDAMEAILSDPEVETYMDDLRSMALLPVPRSSG